MREYQNPDRPEPYVVATTVLRGETIEAAIRRIVIDQYDTLIDALSRIEDVDSAIHTARKAMKRIRALFRLNRDPIRRELLHSENVVLRDVARELAPVRDSFVLVATLDSIAEDLPEGPGPDSIMDARQFVRDNYEHHKRIALADDEHFSGAISALLASRQRIVDIPMSEFPSKAGDDEFSLIRKGLRRTYRSGRRAYKDACREETAGAFHRWRKPIKYLRHQVELISDPDTGPRHDLVGELSELGDLLGLDHDLAVLADLLESQFGTAPYHTAMARVLDAIVKRSTRYRIHAVELGSAVYADAPADFVARMHTQWSAGRTQETVVSSSPGSFRRTQ